MLCASKNLFANNKVKNSSDIELVDTKNVISMMIENENGNYEKTTLSNWPTEEYVFNSELSKCENGAEIYRDDNKKIVVMDG